jgi:hypothetical protein
MRLLDHIARSNTPLILGLDSHPGRAFDVTAPSHYAAQLTQCPLRYVLGDDLTRACAELAFADGARLAGCLDLLRMPAPEVWVEWNDEIHQRVIHETHLSARFDGAAVGRRVGVYLKTSIDGCCAVARTFWAEGLDEPAEVVLSPLESYIDLRGDLPDPADISGVMAGEFAGVCHHPDAAVSSLLGHVRFRFDDAWSLYYRAASTDAGAGRQVVLDSLAGVARDVPLLLAFFLLLSAKDATRSLVISRAAINRKRLARGRPPLLDHIEVSASLDRAYAGDSAGADYGARQSPRLHHVRGHLVRRDNRVFWRVPHLRGSAVRGMVRSRTVCLSFAQPRASEGRAAHAEPIRLQ